MEPRIEVVFGDGTSEFFVLDKAQMTVGRSLEANIAIPDTRDLEPEHLMLKPQLDGCWVAVAQGAQNQAIVSGRPFESGVLPWGTEIQIGALVVVLSGEDTRGRKTDLGQWILGLVILGVAFGGYVWYESRGGAQEAHAPSDFPEIIPAAVPCRVQGPASASRGKTALQAAIAKSDRYPFDPQDGIQAITLFSEALSCFRAAQNEQLSAQAKYEGRRIQQRVEEDYRTRRLGLERALENHNYEQAQNEAAHLLGLVAHTNTNYKAALARTYQWITVQLAAKKKAGK